MQMLSNCELLLPANKVCKGYVFTPVCHSVHREGRGCLPHCMLGYTPPDQRQTPPLDQTPPQVADTPAVHAGRYGQQAGGTHPTGMHSCVFYLKSYFHRIKRNLLECSLKFT